MKKTLYILSVLIFLAGNITVLSAGKRIAFIHPTSKNNTYWPQVLQVVKAVCEDLNMECKAYGFDVGNRYKRHKEGIKILKQKPSLDGVIFSLAFGNAKPFLEAAEKLKIPVILHGQLFPSELPEIGDIPRKKYKMWIAHFCQNEAEKGYVLGKILIERAKKEKLFSPEGTIDVIGVGGDYTWYGSKLRLNGLKKAVKEDSKVRLLQVVPTKWTQEESTAKTLLLLKRYKNISVVWTASDQLAIGAFNALKKINKKAYTGGLDLSRAGLKNVKKKRLEATVASSMLAYGQIVVYLHDYLNGIDFKDGAGTKIYTQIYTATKRNADNFIRLSESYGKIDFKKYSLYYNKNLKSYDFSMERVMKSIR